MSSDVKRAADARRGPMRRKGDLPSKLCLQCGRPFDWRRKWARVWNEVRYCSEACSKAAKQARCQVKTPT